MGNIEEKQTKWEELSISNDFLFGKVMQNPKLCKELLQRILPDLNIERIEYPELQKSINMDMDARSVRLDVYVKDEKEVVYDIEMQVSHTKELPKRSRYYQSMIDLQLIDKGQLYDELKRSYVIFICPFDLYGKGRHIYTFENICKEDNSISMGDEAVKIFLNADGTMDDVSRELKAFPDYVAGQKPEDSYVEKLEEAVQEAKKNGVVTVGITNNPNSSVGSIVDYHIQTATREKLFLNEICFSRVSAMTVIEVLYLFLTVGQERSYDRTSYCESLIADEKL